MTWQLTLASSAAANLKPTIPADPSPTADAAVEWDASLLGPNLALSNANKDVSNTGSNASNGFVSALKPIRPTDGIVYWEVLLQTVSPTANQFEVGFISSFIKGAITSITDALSGNFFGGIAIRDASGVNAEIRRGSTSPYFGAGAIRVSGTVLKFALEAATGKYWVGINGAWLNGAFGTANPDTGIPTGYVMPGMIWWPAVRPSDNGDVFRLQSIAADFSYAKPASCVSYGSDNVKFLMHELPVYNVGQTSNFNGWTIETGAGGSTTYATSLLTYFMYDNSTQASVFDYYYMGQALRNIHYPNQAGTTFGGLWQEHTFDSRFDALIDNGEMRLDMSAFFAKSKTDPAGLGPCRMCAGFYDGSNVLIGSLQLGADINGNPGIKEKFTSTFDVPAGTRKIRLIWRQSKLSADTGTTNRWRITQMEARLVRKIQVVRALESGSVFAVLGKPQGRVGLRASASYAILGKAASQFGVRATHSFAVLGKPQANVGVRATATYIILTP